MAYCRTYCRTAELLSDNFRTVGCIVLVLSDILLECRTAVGLLSDFTVGLSDQGSGYETRGGPADYIFLLYLQPAPGDGLELFSSGCGSRRPPPMRWPQPRGQPRCGQRIGGGLPWPRPEPLRVSRWRSLEGHREPLDGWSALAARTRCRASRSCRGRWRGLPRRSEGMCALHVTCVSMCRSASSHENSRVIAGK